MPELPEVEVVRRGLASHLVGHTVRDVTVLHPRPIRSHPVGGDGFRADVAGRTVDAVRRKGKYMWWVLGDDALITHLGMSGQFLVREPLAELPRHARLVFHLSNDTDLVFADQRMFGGLTLLRGQALDPVPHIALDPFDARFDVQRVARAMRSKHTTVKRALLDQRLVSGIGNIYADESLWRARLHYDLPTQTLGPRQATALLRHARDVMTDALAEGGTSFDQLYVNTHGEAGYFARHLNVYGREGLPCPSCGSAIVRRSFTNRSSFLCPRCQRIPAGVR